jgi:hypothetical protein
MMDNNQKIYQYEYLYKFITNNKPTIDINDFSISWSDLYMGKELYNKFKKSHNPNYEIFGSNGLGYTCFALYKSKEQNIYLIILINQSPIYYIKIENEKVFDIIL